MYEIKHWPTLDCFLIIKSVTKSDGVECYVWSSQGFIRLRDPLDQRAKTYSDQTKAQPDFDEIVRLGR